jgi:hypothetical protein
MGKIKEETKTKIMQKITKNTNVKIQVDADTIIDKPVIEVLSCLVDFENTVIKDIKCRFTAGKTILIRTVGDIQYSTTWVIGDVDTFIVQWILSNTIVEN